MKHEQLIDSLISELNKPKQLTTYQKSLLLANALFSCTLSGFAIFLNKQQTLRLCKEDFHCSQGQAWVFFIPNGISNSLVTIFTSAQLFSAMQRALIGKNNAFYLDQKSSKKIPIRLSLSMLSGLLAAVPIMLSTQDPVGSKLVFVAYFISASYSFYTIVQDLSAKSSYDQPHVKQFLQSLKSYELRGASIYKNIPRRIKIASSILLPLFFNGPFCVSNILMLNNPDNDLGALRHMLPEDKHDRLIASMFLGTTFTVPWFILAGIFGYHLPDTLLQQFYLNPFAKINPNINMSLQIIQMMISLCSFATPVKFFIDVKDELFDSCEDFCTVLTIFVAISGVLFSILPNLKIVELMIIFWNLFLSSDEKNYDETFDIINIRELETQFKDVQITLSAEEVDDISKELSSRLPEMTEYTSLLQYPNTHSREQTNIVLENLDEESRKYAFLRYDGV